MSLLRTLRCPAASTLHHSLRPFSTTTRLQSDPPSSDKPTPSRTSPSPPLRNNQPHHPLFSDFLNRSKTTTPPRPGPLNSVYDLPSRVETDAKAYDTLGRGNQDEFVNKFYVQATKEPTIRLRPPTGRTINVTSSVNPQRALAMLNRLTVQNRISKDANMQRFHERPALRRKRQWRERKERRFEQGVRAAIYRTMQLKKQGW